MLPSVYCFWGVFDILLYLLYLLFIGLNLSIIQTSRKCLVQCTLYGSLKRILDYSHSTPSQYTFSVRNDQCVVGGVMESACGRRPPEHWLEITFASVSVFTAVTRCLTPLTLFIFSTHLHLTLCVSLLLFLYLSVFWTMLLILLPDTCLGHFQS